MAITIHQTGRLGLRMAVWLQAKVRECELGLRQGWTPALSVTHSINEAPYPGYISAEPLPLCKSSMDGILLCC